MESDNSLSDYSSNYTNEENYSLYLICKKCKTIPSINTITFYNKICNIKAECKCDFKEKVFQIDEFRDNYIIDEKLEEENIENYLKCQEHKNNLNKDIKYKYYCEECKINLCDVCIEEKLCKIKHKIKRIEDFESKAKENIEYLSNIFKRKKNSEICSLNTSFSSSIPTELKYTWKRIFSTILEQYKQYPDIIIILNIQKINDFFKGMDPEEKDKENMNNEKIIKDPYEFIKAYENEEERHITQMIINKKALDISIFKEYSFKNMNSLKILNIGDNFIKDIAFLTKEELLCLEELNLHTNRLDDDQIENIKLMKFKELKILNLGNNLFNDYEIFTIIDAFPKLEELYLDSNRLEGDISKYESQCFNYRSIKILNVSNGLFSNDTIDFITYLEFENLTKLDLSSNNLNTLSFIKKIKLGEKPVEKRYLILDNNNICLKEEDKNILKGKFDKVDLIENCSNKIFNLCEFKINIFENKDNDGNDDKLFIINEKEKDIIANLKDII